MNIKRYYMEDWLNDTAHSAFNLSTSGSEDFYLEEFLSLCQADIKEFQRLFLGDNDTRGSLELRKEICKSYQQVSLEELLVTNGTSEALFIFFNEILAPDDEVVLPFPAFQCLYQVPISIGCRVKFLNLLQHKNWKLNIRQLEEIVSPKTRLIIINNPHNPIGWTLTANEIRCIGEIARTNDCYLLFDEHYRYLPLQEGTRLIPSGYDLCKNIHQKTYATGSMIKCFGIVGIRIGWLIGHPRLLALCRDYKDYLTHTIPAVTDFLAYVALKNKEKIIQYKKTHILKNLALLGRFMTDNRHIFEYVEPTGGVVCFPKLKEKSDSKEFCEKLLKKYDVSILPGFTFEVKEHFRINFGVNTKKFSKALALIQTYLREI